MMISIVMFGHALLPYLTIPRSFKDPATHVGFDVVAVFLYGFAMPAFFVTAGFATALIHRRKGTRTLARQRFQFVFLPLLAAYLLISPLTRGAYEFAKHAAISGSLQPGLDILLSGEWIRLGKAYHLWFLVSLLLYTAMAICLRWGVLRFASGGAAQILSASRRLLASRWRATFLSLFVALGMVPAYVIHGEGATTLPMQLALFGFFVLGWLLYLHRDLLPTFEHQPWRPIAVALVTLPLAAWSTRERLMSPDESQLVIGVLAGVTNSILGAFMTFGLLGVYQARFSHASALGRYVSDASYWIYLIHLPLLVAVSGTLSVTPLPAVIKYLLTVAIVVPIVVSSYHFGVRSTRFGALLKSGNRRATRRVP